MKTYTYLNKNFSKIFPLRRLMHQEFRYFKEVALSLPVPTPAYLHFFWGILPPDLSQRWIACLKREGILSDVNEYTLRDFYKLQVLLEIPMHKGRVTPQDLEEILMIWEWNQFQLENGLIVKKMTPTQIHAYPGYYKPQQHPDAMMTLGGKLAIPMWCTDLKTYHPRKEDFSSSYGHSNTLVNCTEPQYLKILDIHGPFLGNYRKRLRISEQGFPNKNISLECKP